MDAPEFPLDFDFPALPVRPRDLFRLVAEEAFRDGVIEPAENEILQKMAGFLRLGSQEAREVVKRARARFEAGELGDQRPLSPGELYNTVLIEVLADGEVDPMEEAMLAGLQKVLGLDGREAFAAGVDPAAATVSDLPIPEPGGATAHLAAQTDPEGFDAWRRDYAFWGRATSGASDAAKAAWAEAVRGVEARDPARVEEALAGFRAVLASADGGPLVDRVATLRLARLGRLLLAVRGAGEAGDPLRRWPGEAAYAALSAGLAELLVTLRAGAPTPVVDRALSMVTAGLFEDFAALVERGHDEPLSHLVPALAMACRGAAHLAVAAAAAPVLTALADQVEGDATRARGAVVELGRVFCETLDPAHPLARAGDAALARLAPMQRVFPATPGGEPAAPGPRRCGDACDRLARLARRVAARAAASRGLLAEWEGADRRAVEAALGAGTPGPSRLVLQAFPVLGSWPRPVIVASSADPAGGHHAALRGRSPGVVLVRVEGGGLRAELTGSRRLGSEVVSVPLDREGAAAFARALDAAGGAWDLALVSAGRGRARLWYGAGELDPTGTVATPGDAPGRRARLAEASSRHPWMTQAELELARADRRVDDALGVRQHLEAAMARQPHRITAQVWLGQLFEGLKDHAAAARLLTDALRRDPFDLDAAGAMAAYALAGAARGDAECLAAWDFCVPGWRVAAPGHPGLKKLLARAKEKDPALLRRLPGVAPEAGFLI